MPPQSQATQQLTEIKKELESVARLADKHEVELHGPRGVYSAILELYVLEKWRTRALWAIAAAVVAAAILAALGLKG